MSYLLMLGENLRGRRMSHYRAVFFVHDDFNAVFGQRYHNAEHFYAQMSKYDGEKSVYGDYFYVFVEVEDE